ncbi:Inner membrane protein YghB [compost metagenome]
MLWVGSVVTLGYAFSQIPLVKRHEDQVMAGLMILPMVLLVVGLLGVMLVVWRKKRAS